MNLHRHGPRESSSTRPKPTRRAVLAAASAAALLAGCGSHEGRAFLCAASHPEGYPTVQAVLEMGRLLRERTDGKLGITMYAGA